MTLNSIINETNYKSTLSPRLLSNSNLLNNCKTFEKDFYFSFENLFVIIISKKKIFESNRKIKNQFRH
jgi:hypothetical protein